MQVYAVTITEQRERRIRLAAASREGAIEAARAVARPKDRVVDVRLWGERDTRAGEEALSHLLSRDYLTFDGKPYAGGIAPTVGDWLTRAAGGLLAANERLALAGLRVLERRVFVGSPSSIPALAGWFRGTAWEGPELLAVLALLPGALRTNCTFAGLRSRAVSLPMESVYVDPPAA
jgi:hypothetical protein